MFVNELRLTAEFNQTKIFPPLEFLDVNSDLGPFYVIVYVIKMRDIFLSKQGNKEL